MRKPGQFCGYYRFKKGFTDFSTYPQYFKKKLTERSDTVLPARLDDIILVTRGNKQGHKKKLFDVLNKLEKAGYRASTKRSEFFMKQSKRLGHEIDENKIEPNEDKVEAIFKLNPPENRKKLKSFLRAIQYMENFLPKHLERTDQLRKLIKK